MTAQLVPLVPNFESCQREIRQLLDSASQWVLVAYIFAREDEQTSDHAPEGEDLQREPQKTDEGKDLRTGSGVVVVVCCRTADGCTQALRDPVFHRDVLSRRNGPRLEVVRVPVVSRV